MMISHRGKKSLKLLGAVRGGAVLHHGEKTIQVSVDASEFEERGRTSVTGSLDGPLGGLENGDEAKLVLADSRELAIRVIEPDDQGADFRTT